MDLFPDNISAAVIVRSLPPAASSLQCSHKRRAFSDSDDASEASEDKKRKRERKKPDKKEKKEKRKKASMLAVCIAAAAAAAPQVTIQATPGWHLARGTKVVGALLPDIGYGSPNRRLRYSQVAVLPGLQYSTSQNYHAVLFLRGMMEHISPLAFKCGAMTLPS